MKFHIARLSFVSSAQKILQKPEFEGTPIELAEKLLVENEWYTPKKSGFVGLYLGDFIFDPDRKLLAARLAKLKAKEVKITKIDEHKKGFRDRIDESYPYVYLLWDRDEQAILVEKDMSIFPDYEVLFRSIENHLNNLLKRYELRVSVTPLTEKMDFWRFIHAYRYLYEANFKLYMPNFFGNTQKELKELLDAVKEDYNATEFSNQISNTDGRLNIQENDPKTNAALEWIMKGGGVWSIKGKKKEGKRKVKITSTKNAKTVDTSVEIENYTADEMATIVSSLKREYSIKNGREENDVESENK